MYNTDTIVALATPKSISALAIIRCSGEEIFEIINRCVVEKKRFLKAIDNSINVYKFIDNNINIIDEVTIIKYKNPKSYTGENMVEIISHGSELIISDITKTLVSLGVRYAEKGEFTKRAFINGKKNILQAESVNNIIHSKNRTQKNNALNNYFGKYNNKIFKYKESLEIILSLIESNIEFAEEDDIKTNIKDINIKEELTKINKKILKEIKIRNSIKVSEKGINIVLAGPVNAGKSTLLNILLEYDRAIVDKKEGTTRDFISESMDIKGKNINLIDTAGIREADDLIEKKGIDKSIELVKNSDFIIWVTSNDENFTEKELNLFNKKKNIIAIINKNDITINRGKEDYFLNNKIDFINTNFMHKKNKEYIDNFIYNKINNKINTLEYDTFIINERQELLVKNIQKNIQKALNEYDFGFEIISYYLKEAYSKIQEIYSIKNSDDIINSIFNNFCIGK